MTSPEIKTLIQFLQNNGRSIINGQSKFSVTPQILRELNKIMHSIKQDIYMSSLSTTSLIHKYSGNNELMFLYDFIKKMPKLKISETSSSLEFSINISDFTNLKYLELYKFNVKKLKGIQFLRDMLEVVVCSRCLDKVGDLFLNSDTDSGGSSIWSKLQHAVLSRNNLTTIDQSFIYTPWLQYLDISYNSLTDLRPLTCLSNLTYLNVSYNHLSCVPEISMSKLEVLKLNNNYITEISGLSKMENLRELDLSENSIIQHVSLLPLADLPFIISLNLSRNPISHHPNHRGLTCGYLHENVDNNYFLLDGNALSNSEKEFIRHTLPPRNRRIFSDQKNCFSSTVVKKKHSKKTRDAFIAERSVDDEIFNENIQTSTPKKIKEEEVYDDEDQDYIIMKRQIEERIEKDGPLWLVKNKPSKTLEFPSPTGSVKENSPLENADDTLIASVDTTLENESVEGIEPIPIVSEEYDSEINEKENHVEEEEEEEEEATEEEEEEEEEEDDEENDIRNFSDVPLWLVKRIDGDSRNDLFLVLYNGLLKEFNVISTKVITTWSLDCVERCSIISDEPLTIMLVFEVIKRSNRIRKYIMEYSDAQTLIDCVQKELDKKPKLSLNQIACRCLKCNLRFRLEIQRRLAPTPSDEEKYVCPSCDSVHVVEEDESESPIRRNVDNDVNKSNAQDSSKVTQSPSLSSIGSAASLDQNSDIACGHDETRTSCQESDIEIISNPSQSSIEVLEVHNSRSQDNNVAELPKGLERISSAENPLSLVNAAVNQILTESSSSGSMTDSICTSYETTQHSTRGPHRVSQSTVDEVLVEESSAETSPQQRRSEEKTILEESAAKLKNDRNTTINSTNVEISLANYATVIEALKEKCQIASSPRKSLSAYNDLDTLYEYSYTNFTNIDHRIKYYIWDQLAPNNVEISAFLRVDKMTKSGTMNYFPGLLVLTEKILYFAKIVKEEKNDPLDWLQKYDKICTEKIKLIQPILWKQGFCIEVEDKPGSGITLKYLCFLYDEKRTENFLAYVKDLGSIHVNKLEDFSKECVLKHLIQIDQNIRNFTMTDLVTICGSKEVKRHNFMGLVVTDSDIIIVKAETDWLLPNSTAKPSIVLTESIGNLMKVMKSENGIVLQFMDEIERTDHSWEIKTVTLESKRKIIEAIREPWEDLFSVPLEVLHAAI